MIVCEDHAPSGSKCAFAKDNDEVPCPYCTIERLTAEMERWKGHHKSSMEQTAERVAQIDVLDTKLDQAKAREKHVAATRNAFAEALKRAEADNAKLQADRKALENIIEHQEFEKLFHKEVTEKIASSNRIGHLTWGDMREAFKFGLVVGKQQAEADNGFEDNYPNDYDEVTGDER